MRIGIVSDVHGNVAGLQSALDRMGPIDELLCAGDTVYQYRWSNETVELLRGRGARVVLGNHDEIILGRDGDRARSMEHVREDLVEWLREQPYSVDAQIVASASSWRTARPGVAGSTTTPTTPSGSRPKRSITTSL